MHVGLNLERSNAASTQAFIDFYGFEFVPNDCNRTVAGRFQAGGQPLFAIINGLAGSTSHRQW